MFFNQHPWLLYPSFVTYHNKSIANKTQIDSTFEDDSDEEHTQTNEFSSTQNILSLTDTDIFQRNSQENIFDAVKQQWWFNIFDPRNSQFDVNNI